VTWRRILVPAGTSLGRLHHIVQVALDWDGDHLHVFTIDGIGYADADHGLEGCGDEETVTLPSALPRPARHWPTATISATAGTTPSCWRRCSRPSPARVTPSVSAVAATRR
jgi:hypothetical protein